MAGERKGGYCADHKCRYHYYDRCPACLENEQAADQQVTYEAELQKLRDTIADLRTSLDHLRSKL